MISSAGNSLYRYKRLSFGVNNAPKQYQNIIRHTIANCTCATNIADDIVVHGRTTEEHHLEHAWQKSGAIAIEWLHERNLTLDKDKYKIGMNQIVLMGLLWSELLYGSRIQTKMPEF